MGEACSKPSLSMALSSSAERPSSENNLAAMQSFRTNIARMAENVREKNQVHLGFHPDRTARGHGLIAMLLSAVNPPIIKSQRLFQSEHIKPLRRRGAYSDCARQAAIRAPPQLLCSVNRFRRIREPDGPSGVERLVRIALAAVIDEIPMQIHDAVGG